MKKKQLVAIIDDDEDTLELLEAYLVTSNYRVQCYHSLQEWRTSNSNQQHDMILCDVMLPNMSGLKILHYSQDLPKKIPIIMMTAHADIERAVEALKKGAYDFLQKPLKLERLLHTIRQAFDYFALEDENNSLKKHLQSRTILDNLIGVSSSMKSICELARRVAPTMTNVLITGESGTGKEVIARAIHNASHREKGPFIAINCSAIPEGLLESELFGHAKGAFTGATSDRPGLFQEARGGTLFLDEIGDMPLPLQAKLLRVLQERKVRPVGKNIEERIDVRIISATHRDVRPSSKSIDFREDLYYRLSVIPIHIPPLRQRREDIPILAQHFLKKYQKVHNSLVKALNPCAVEKLVNIPWHGNVRELESTIERTVILCPRGIVYAADIPWYDPEDYQDIIRELAGDEFPTLKEIEGRYVYHVLQKVEGNKKKAAKILGKNWRTIYRKINDNSSHSGDPQL